MSATLATMEANVKLKVGNKAGIDSTIDDNINKAVLYVLTTMRPQEMWATVSFSASTNTAEYAFTGAAINKTDVYAIMMIRDTTKDREILRGSIRHYNRLRQDTSSSGSVGDPRRWARLGNSLVLYSRIPDSTARTIKMTYLKRPATMTAAVDFPLNDEWQRPVEEYAAFLTWNDLNEFTKAQARLASYQALTSTMEKPEAIEDEAPEAAVRPFVDPAGDM